MKFLLYLFLISSVVSCSDGKVLGQLAIEDIPEIEYNRELEGRIRRLGYQIKKINEAETKSRISVMRRKTFDRKMQEVKDNYEKLIDFIEDNESKSNEKKTMLMYQQILFDLNMIKTNYPISRSYSSVGVNL